ncbi:hypothetical protein EV209_2598 [Cuneatibacter caecimuris]|uniref:Uncharacterized protein n=1 Tax=Cuneatibacter caecimuris TaxID=1796618 RepID=A0A4Q7P460_9FIRM|nr:hypothetical protein EV209_2598 [Cuneatibacter caecimuris]
MLCKKQLYIYLPSSIQKIHEAAGDKVKALFAAYPFEIYGDPFIKRALRRFEVKYSSLAFQECYDAASDAYLYSIHRCAWRGYDFVEFYIRKMIPISIRWALVICDEGKNICQANGLSRICLDDPDQERKW